MYNYLGLLTISRDLEKAQKLQNAAAGFVYWRHTNENDMARLKMVAGPRENLSVVSETGTQGSA